MGSAPSTTAPGSGATAAGGRGWPRVKIHYRSGTRIRPGDHRRHRTDDVHFDVESKLPVPIHVGGGYGGDSDWLHGTWKGDKFVERLTYDMTDPAIIARSHSCHSTMWAVLYAGTGDDPVQGWGRRSTRARPSLTVRFQRLANGSNVYFVDDRGQAGKPDGCGVIQEDRVETPSMRSRM